MDRTVTVITTAYNAAAYLEKCIESVLAQTVPCRLIVVDDASTDGTLGIARRYAKENEARIEALANDANMGVAGSRNRAVQQARTEYIAYLDADDWWEPDKIERQLLRIKETQADACYSGRELMTAAGERTGKIVHVPERTDYKSLLKGNVIPCSSVLMRREDALRYPMTHDELHEDYITWLSMLRDGKRFVGIDEPLLKSRLCADGKSGDKRKSAKMTWGVYRYMGIPAWKAAYYFCCYAVAGIRKY